VDGERSGTGVGGSVSHTVADPYGTIRFEVGVGDVGIVFGG